MSGLKIKNSEIQAKEHGVTLQGIYNKIIESKNLTEKEIYLISSDTHKIAVHGFTHSIGHLTIFGKNEMVKQYKDEILQEMKEHLRSWD